MTARLVILKTGDTVSTVIDRHGDYDAMFRAVLDPLDLEIEVVDAFRSAPLPGLEDYDFAIITGSPQSVTKPEAWTETLAAWCRTAHAARKPLLGVCYGHQLLAYALGGTVVQTTDGLEMGTVDIELTDAGKQDRLLGALAAPGSQPRFHQVHGDVVNTLPPEAVHLAKNEHTELQGFRVGDRTWGVQFHPEFTFPVMQIYVDARADRLRSLAQAAGLDAEAELTRARESLGEAPCGPRLLHRFVELAKEL